MELTYQYKKMKNDFLIEIKRVFLIEKIEKPQSKFLFRVHSAHYWTESIEQATQFETEKHAEDFMMEEVRDLKKTIYKINSYYFKK